MTQKWLFGVNLKVTRKWYKSDSKVTFSSQKWPEKVTFESLLCHFRVTFRLTPKSHFWVIFWVTLIIFEFWLCSCRPPLTRQAGLGSQSSAEPLGFCRAFLQQAFYYGKHSAEPSCGTAKVLQNSGEPVGARTHLLRTGFFSSQEVGVSQKSGFQNGGFGWWSLDTPNQNEGTISERRYQKPERGYKRNGATVPKIATRVQKNGTTVPKAGPRVHSPKPPFYKTVLICFLSKEEPAQWQQNISTIKFWLSSQVPFWPNYYKIIPRNNYFCNNLCKYYRENPPERFLCNVAATGLSLFAREHANEFAL